jgi:metal-responsive CopG/Arc/MetJ family transcriptional regulator
MIRSMPRPNPVEQVVIRLPVSLLREVERVRRATGESRSAVIRRSIELLLGRAEQSELVPKYVEGHLAHPEGRSEVGVAMATAAEALEDEPWE